MLQPQRAEICERWRTNPFMKRKNSSYFKDGPALCFRVHFLISPPLCSLKRLSGGLEMKKRTLVTASLNFFDRLGVTGWGELMCNTLLCSNDYCQHATGQGRPCVAGRTSAAGGLVPVSHTGGINPPLLNKVALIEQPSPRVATVLEAGRAGTGSPFLRTSQPAQQRD